MEKWTLYFAIIATIISFLLSIKDSNLSKQWNAQRTDENWNKSERFSTLAFIFYYLTADAWIYLIIQGIQ